MWGPDGEEADTLAVIPDSSLRRRLPGRHRRLPRPRRLRPGHDGLGAQRRPDGPGGRGVRLATTRPSRSPPPARSGSSTPPATCCIEHDVEAGDIWRACQTKDVPIRDWVKLAVTRARATGAPGGLLARRDPRPRRQPDRQGQGVPPRARHRRASTSRSWRRPTATAYSLERIRKGEDTISVTGNVLRDYITDLFPILELGTSAKMLSIVPLIERRRPVRDRRRRLGAQARAAAGQGELPALGQPRRVLRAGRQLRAPRRATTGNAAGQGPRPTRSTGPPARSSTRTSRPGRKLGTIDNRGSHFYLALYWAQELADADRRRRAGRGVRRRSPRRCADERADDRRRADRRAGLARPTSAATTAPTPSKAAAVMRPSTTFNEALASLELTAPVTRRTVPGHGVRVASRHGCPGRRVEAGSRGCRCCVDPDDRATDDRHRDRPPGPVRPDRRATSAWRCSRSPWAASRSAPPSS